jgi:hypothetical protein
MAKSYEVLEMLCEGVEYVCRGLEYEDIDWLGKNPAITKKQFTDGFAQYDTWNAQQNAAKSAAKTAVYDKLGLTAEEVSLLLA